MRQDINNRLNCNSNSDRFFLHVENFTATRRRNFSYAYAQNFPGKALFRSLIILLLMVVGITGVWAQTTISSLSDITEAEGSYTLASDFSTTGTPANGIGTTSNNPFKGTIDGGLVTITGTWDKPLFEYVEDATIKNVIIGTASVSATGNAGAIAANAKGETRIYNCGILSGTVGGTAYTGGLVGLLDHKEANKGSRVINCFSYATITSGTDVGGIVGYNNYASYDGDIRTMVMNCMFYGNITGGTNKSPVYGGKNINNISANSNSGLNTFNYYCYEELTGGITDGKYNCALAVEKKYLNHFEFYRQLLNSNKKLAAIYITGNAADANILAKWVLETADRTIDNPKPYPILKAQGKYPSIINYDTGNLEDYSEANRNKGLKTGTLNVTISNTKSNGGQTWPTDANITDNSLTLIRTDKDFDRFNYNYDKVQLPYYNEVGEGNYTGGKVVTGWKIVSMDVDETVEDHAVEGTYTASDTWGGYNFADRKTYAKDLYSKSGRVFSQGAYFDVPYGVTAITIEPYWGNAAYLANESYDVVYTTGYARKNVSQLGTQVGSSTTFNGQKVYTSVNNALNAISNKGTTVYDNAIVLVGNFHQTGVPSDGDTPFTMMSVDWDKDNEPDYSMIYHHNGRQKISPIRFDFLNIPGTAQAQKPNGTTTILNFTIFKARGWFETTNTSLVYSNQVEYENQDKVTKLDNSPLILLGGNFEQFVSTQRSAVNGKTIYIHVGSNVSIQSFGLGTHSDGSTSTPHVPVSVTGGKYDGFYLTGTYNPNAAERTDNAECYISGGYFKELAGACQESINGNVQWQIYNADIDNFFGGGINDARPIKGTITTDIINSYVGTFCGGPKFGNMTEGKDVTTRAKGCVFDEYFGAGYGGLSYSRQKYYDESNYNFETHSFPYTSERGKYYDGTTTNANNSKPDYGKKGPGVATDFDYEFFVWSTGTTGARMYVNFASFSLAQCDNVSSTLTGCTINRNFYGGGNLGKVTGKSTSVLDGCTVKGNVFGGGYSATLPTIQVRDAGFTKNPKFNNSSGMFEPGEFSPTTEFTWKNATEASRTLTNGQSGSDMTNHYIYTDVNLTTLGQVGNTDLTIKGNTQVVGGVFGGGDESAVLENTKVDIQNSATSGIGNVFGGGNIADVDGRTDVTMTGGKVNENVFGGGNEADVKKNTEVTITSGTVTGSVYGGGKLGSVGTVTAMEEHKTIKDEASGAFYDFGLSWPIKFTYEANTGLAKVTVKDDATVGYVFGGGKGKVEVGENDIFLHRYKEALVANVREAQVIIGTAGGDSEKPVITNSVYGGGEDGHVNEDATITIHTGAIGHSVFGGGKGEGTYTTKLLDPEHPNTEKVYPADHPNGEEIHSWIAGRVFGNTTITMNDGSVGYNIYGGGNLASVGKGSYAGGTDDYSTAGYGELPPLANQALWASPDTEGTYPYYFKHSGIATVTVNGGTIGSDGTVYSGLPTGNVFGSSRGKAALEVQGALSPRYKYIPDFFLGYVNETLVTIGDATKINDESYTGPMLYGSVYGGGQDGHVRRDTHVTINKGTIGQSGKDTGGYVFGAGSGIGKNDVSKCNNSSGSVTCTTNVEIKGGTIYNNVYGGGALASVGPPHTGQGFDESKSATDSRASYSYTQVNIKGGDIKGSVYGASRGPNDALLASVFTGDNVYDGTKFATTLWSDVNITGNAAIAGSVYGGGEKGIVKHATEVNIGIPAIGEAAAIPFTGTIGTDVFGGGQEAVVGGNVTVNMNSGTVTRDVYGGGAFAHTNTNKSDAANTTGAKPTAEEASATTRVNLLGGTIHDAYGGGLGDATRAPYVDGDILVDLNGTTTSGTSGSIKNPNTKGCVVGQVFGCNNINGTPKGNVMVHVYGTQNKDASMTNIAAKFIKSDGYLDYSISNYSGLVSLAEELGLTIDTDKATLENGSATDEEKKTALSNITTAIEAVVSSKRYDVTAVYGGGNKAAYEPEDPTNNKTQVYIEGCDYTCIEYVYGGGNAAPTPSTDVTVNSSYEIDYLFGGGNGTVTPADVGYHKVNNTDTEYGTGMAVTQLIGGTINHVFGGSNSQGNVRVGTSVTMPSSNSSCPLNVKELYGAGQNAEQDGGVAIILGCVTGMDYVYGGAKDANVKGGVDLVITSGHFKQIFGGNDTSGTIQGPIKVTIEETGCDPVEIEELYLGGKEAAYSMYGYYKDTNDNNKLKPRTATDTEEAKPHDGTTPIPYAPSELNIVSCTSIGKVFGGGLGAGAIMYGNPSVNVNMIPGKFAANLGGEHKLGTIGDVYGGGSAANVVGITTVNIGTKQEVLMRSEKDEDGVMLTIQPEQDIEGARIVGNVYGGGLSADVIGNTNVNIGTKSYTTTGYEGVNITGNVFGGGEGQTTQVTGTVAVKIGNKTAGSGDDPDTYEGNAIITGDIYGGSAFGSVNAYDNSGTLTPTDDATTSVTLNIGSITGSVYGGGLGQRNGVNDATSDIISNVYGPVTVTVNDGSVSGAVYGCNNLNGSPQSTVAVNITGTTVPTNSGAYSIPAVYGGGNLAPYTGTPTVTVSGGFVNDVFGGGLGASADVTGNPTVNISGGHVLHDVYGGGSQANVTGSTTVSVSGGTVENDVYGGGSLADVTGSVTVNISGGKIVNDVYGGGALANTNTGNWDTAGSAIEYKEVTGLAELTYRVKETTGLSTVNGLFTFNGTEYIAASGPPLANTTYYERLSGSPVAGYYILSSGSYEMLTSGTATTDGTYYRKKVKGTWVTTPPIDETKYYTTSVNLTGGLVGNVYGGALGNLSTAANVYGDVTVTVNEGVTEPDKGVAFSQKTETAIVGGVEYPTPVAGRVFGCNNVNGTPTGDVTVHVYSTRQLDADDNILPGHGSSDRKYTYEIQAVYGGGNKSDYLPADGKKTKVIIDGCNETSIENVYGGGNSCVVPNTDVVINGSYDISHAFGGGNGGQPVKKDGEWQENDGAIVINLAKITCKGGKIGYVYGAGDAKGSCGNTSVDTSGGTPGDEDYCPLVITHLYGAGNKGDVPGSVNTILAACSDSPIEYVHGGSYNAHILGDVTLTITSGILKNVYGGNDARGGIYGNITVNIEETDGCNPIIIQNLVGGGNMAPYPGTYKNDSNEEIPYTHHGKITVNVKSATHIENIYGGSFQAEANADTEVNINMMRGNKANETVDIPKEFSYIPNISNITNNSDGKTIRCKIDDAIGTIGNVYGGGNLGLVRGDAFVNIGSSNTVDIMKRNANNQILDTSNPPQVISVVNGENITATIAYESKPVKGAHITGNVFGGGSEADVTGNTYVNIYTKQTPVVEEEVTTGYDYETVDFSGVEDFEGITIGNSVYGGGSQADVKKNTRVTMGGGYVFDGVYGGGFMGSVGSASDVEGSVIYHTGTEAHSGCIGKIEKYETGTGKCTVVVSGGQVGPAEVAGHYDSAQGKVLTNGGMKNDGRYFKETGDPNGPVAVGFVFGAGRGEVVNPAVDPDADFHTYVRETDVTISGTALIMASVYGGGENGRVRGNTHVNIQGGQIGCGEGMVDSNNKPIRYEDAQFINPLPTAEVTNDNKLAECAHWDYGVLNSTTNKKEYLPYDPLAEDGDTESSKIGSDGHTYYGCVFGGGSGYSPYEVKNAAGTVIGHEWLRSAGWVEGNTMVDITGGHILTSIYGGNEMTDVGRDDDADTGVTTGKCTVNFGGTATLGVPRTLDQIALHPVTCYLFGAGKGDQRTRFNTWTNVNEAEVNVTGGTIYGSVFGGGEDGHVLRDVRMNIGNDDGTGPTIGTWGTSYVDGNIFGGGRGFSGDALTAGSIGGNVEVNIKGGTMLGSIYGGGRLASVGIGFNNTDNPNYGMFTPDADGKTYGHVTINITGGTIGNDREDKFYASSVNTTNLTEEEIATARATELANKKAADNIPNTDFYYDSETNRYIVSHTTGGNVFGGSMGRLTRLDGSLNPLWPRLGQVKYATVNISGDNTVIKSNVYGGSEFGTVNQTAKVLIGKPSDESTTITKPTIKRDVFGGGYGSINFTDKTTFTADGVPFTFTPMQFAGCVGVGTEVKIYGGWVKKNVYGGGEMASVGVINYADTVRHDNVDNSFALSWPYKVSYVEGYPGTSEVYIYGGRIGITGKDFIGPFNASGQPLDVTNNNAVLTPGDGNTADDKKIKKARIDNGDVFGAGKGVAGDRYNFGFCANVKNSKVTIDYPSDNDAEPGNYKDKTGSQISNYVYTKDCIAGSVYGGSENGHVTDDAEVILKKGLIGHAIYGGGKGKDTYTKKLTKIGGTEKYNAYIYGLTAGKVFGNTKVTMEGGYVVRNIYGGGNMASVGKGNYAGGPDDYSTSGYGELASGSLWNNTSDDSKAFLSSGKTEVIITGGQVGMLTPSKLDDSEKDGLPYGNVFGGCRGEAAPNIFESPRYEYCPAFFSGYVNETSVTIGTAESSTGPAIFGSVYGGGQDGHVRRDTHVIINSGEIGKPYTNATAANTLVGTSDVNSLHWQHRGNVYGSGSGIGQYEYDFNYNGRHTTTEDGDEIEVHNYVNPLRPTAPATPMKEVDYSTSAGSVTRFTTVDIKGGTIHRNVYGGGSLATVGAPKIPPTRPDDPIRRDDSNTATKGKQTLNKVNINGGTIGETTSYNASGIHVYGGSVYAASRGMKMEAPNNQSDFATAIYTELNVLNGTIYGSVYGGGELGTVKKNTNVNLLGGTIAHDAYGGGRGTSEVAADIGGDVLVELNNNNNDQTADGTKTGCVVKNIFGCNDLNGTPKGHVKVHVFATQHPNKTDNPKITNKYTKFKKLSDYTISNYSDNTANDDLTKLATTVGMTSTEITNYATILEKTSFTEAEMEEYGKDLTLSGLTNEEKTAKIKNAVLENYIYAIANKKYDVQHVYGGGNLAAYHPTDADSNVEATQEAARTEVIIDGCAMTSIMLVYGGGNAASASGTYVRVNGTYEIHEVFGGGNGKDPYQLQSDSKWYENPGANVGYHNYMHYVKTGETGHADATHGTGDLATPYIAFENDDATNKDLRQANYRYGSGIATTEVVGGRMHNVYGGSNQRGNISTMAMSAYQESGTCELVYDKAYNAGKNAEIDGEATITIDCATSSEAIIFGGSSNADINSGVTLNITNGTYEKIFGGSDIGGKINGPITVNIQEQGCKPIFIKELYGGGNQADYSIFGYYNAGTTEAPNYKPRTKAIYETEKTAALASAAATYPENATEEDKAAADKNALIAAGLWGLPHRNPHVNVISATKIDDIFGGGYKALVIGNPHINVNMENGMILAKYMNDTDYPVGVEKTDGYGNKYYVESLGEEVELEGGGTKKTGILRIGTIGNIFGGGNEADIDGSPQVEIGTGTHHNNNEVEEPLDRNAATITNSVYGGCNKGDVTGNTSITMAHGSVSNRIYGGGNLGSVGTFTHTNGKPTACTDGTGTCTILVTGDAEVGPNDMTMTPSDPTFDKGHVFGASRGTIDLYYDANTNMTDADKQTAIAALSASDLATMIAKLDNMAYVNKTEVTINDNAFVKGSVYGGSENGHVLNDTHVTIDGNCQIGNGFVQMDNSGNYLTSPLSMNRPYSADEWAQKKLIMGDKDRAELNSLVSTTYYTNSLPECASWKYNQATGDAKFAAYDPYALPSGYYDSGSTKSAEGGRPTGDDGHTFYGNVFGGGSGYYPYAPGKWIPKAGWVEGNTKVEVKGGHILTNLYGGNEMTNVGDGVTAGKGKCEIIMTGGTLGVPRTLGQIAAHPVTCYLFGAGKGDPRIFFNQSTNVREVKVDMTGGWVYGSVFGGGEDGHVLEDVTMNVSESANAPENPTYANYYAGEATKIGTWGTSYVDGNIFGGGRGFDGTALTAGIVSGNINMDISGGTMLGSIYGGGRLGSVGTYLVPADDTSGRYGKLIPDGKEQVFGGTDVTATGKKHGYITINISGGTIGNDNEYAYIAPTVKGNDLAAAKANMPQTLHDENNQLLHTKGGNVFTGGMGRRLGQDGTPMAADWWPKLGVVKSTNLTIKGNARIKSNVYGGGEFGAVNAYTDNTNPESPIVQGGTTTINIQGGEIGTEVKDGEGTVKYTYGSVFGGGYGTEDEIEDVNTSEDAYRLGALVKGNSTVGMSGGHVWASVFGGGELAATGGNTNVTISGGEIGKNEVKPKTNSDPGYVMFGGATMGNVYGGGKGNNTNTLLGVVLGNTNVTVQDAIADADYAAAHDGVSAGDVISPKIYHNVYGGGALGSVGTFIFSDGVTNTGVYKYMETVPKGIPLVWTANTGKATVNIKGGTIGISGRDNGMVDGSSRGGIAKPIPTVLGVSPTGTALKDPYDKMAWVESAIVTIGEEGKAGPHIKGSVYGGGENGHVFTHATVNVKSGTIGIVDEEDPWFDFGDPKINEAAWTTRGNVYGAGCGTDMYDSDNDGVDDTHNAWAGCVIGNTEINISGGLVAQNVYGGGSMGSVGRILEGKNDIVKHEDATDGFALSWPVKFTYQDLSNNTSTGKATINITGGRIGTTGSDNGDVFGGTRGEAGDRYEMAQFANVRETEVNINYPETPTDDNLIIEDNIEDGKTKQSLRIKLKGEDGNFIPAIAGSAYGGCENGHVNENTSVTLTNGLIGHAVYGGGKGKGTYTKKLKKIGAPENVTIASNPEWFYDADIYGLCAGKVFGNTSISMTGGHVIRNIYGGGNMGSIGKGNYAGGLDDYSEDSPISKGYGEHINDNLWDNVNDNSKAFLSSGKTAVSITGGTIGYMIHDETVYKKLDGTTTTFGAVTDADTRKKLFKVCSKDDLPTGNVFGGARGESAPNIQESPRYEYCPAFFSGYVNETDVKIGKARDEFTGDGADAAYAAYTGPRIYGSVYGGGQDGHVRRDTKVTINKGEIGIPYTTAYQGIFGTNLDDIHWLNRGNVYGSGSGVGKYEYDFNYDKKIDDTVEGITYHGNPVKEKDFSTSAGSVTRFTDVNINDGIIHRNVYGGGSLASVGPPKIGQSYEAYKQDLSNSETIGKQSMCSVNVSGTVGTPDGYVSGFKFNPNYGGEVYGASRGDKNVDTTQFGTTVWTLVKIKNGANIMNNVFGGGDAGMVKKDSEVIVGD